MLEDSTNRELLAAWRDGNESAATVLVRRYMARLTSLASSRLSRKLARRVDAEDVVLSAWRSFFVATGRNQVDVPGDDNLWPLLVTMTLRKLARQAARHSADRRSIHAETEQADDLDWPAVVAREPTPAEAAMVTDEIESLMFGLSSSDREILTRRLQGEQHSSIADAVGCSERTVRRSLQRVRDRYLANDQSETTNRQVPDESNKLMTDAFPTAATVVRHKALDTSSGRTTEQLAHEGAAFESGDVVLERLVGQGTFGKVYRATRCADGATVAVKYLRKIWWKTREAREQLVREASVVSTLTHPGIIQHFGWGCARRGGLFLVMEWVDGDDLNKWATKNRPSFAQIVQCGIAVCRALDAAHAAGVVHADLTPANVLRRRDETFVVTDFGFSRRPGDVGMNVAAGTPGFLAPEQLSDAFGAISPQTDVFGLGSVLYFLLTGQPPFIGRDTAETFALTLSSRPVPRIRELVPGANSDLEQLIADCLSHESASRPDSVAAVAEILMRL